MPSLSPLGRAALAYAEHGWFVFPLLPQSKVPFPRTEGFKEASKNPDHIRRLWGANPTANIGLRPGPSGMIVSDAENAAGEAELAAAGLIAVPTLMVRTGRGRHLYHAGPSRPVATTSWGTASTIRHWKGYVVVPPSIHPDGQQYEWAGTIEDLTPLPEVSLARLAFDEATPAARPMPQTADGLSDLSPALERRIRAYLDKLPTGLRDGGGRNSVGYALAAFLVRDLQLSDTLADRWLNEWNRRQADPLGAKELGAVLTHAHDYGRHPYGAGLERRALSLAPLARLHGVRIQWGVTR
jgi:bifunctional DNA primase/polymerase-like protein